jgi:hypothetical protein
MPAMRCAPPKNSTGALEQAPFLCRRQVLRIKNDLGRIALTPFTAQHATVNRFM